MMRTALSGRPSLAAIGDESRGRVRRWRLGSPCGGVVDRRAVVRGSRVSGTARLAVTALGAALVIVAAKKGKKRVKAATSVYVEEVSSGARPIQAVGSAIAAFVGLAPG